MPPTSTATPSTQPSVAEHGSRSRLDPPPTPRLVMAATTRVPLRSRSQPTCGSHNLTKRPSRGTTRGNRKWKSRAHRRHNNTHPQIHAPPTRKGLGSATHEQSSADRGSVQPTAADFDEPVQSTSIIDTACPASTEIDGTDGPSGALGTDCSPPPPLVDFSSAGGSRSRPVGKRRRWPSRTQPLGPEMSSRRGFFISTCKGTSCSHLSMGTLFTAEWQVFWRVSPNARLLPDGGFGRELFSVRESPFLRKNCAGNPVGEVDVVRAA